MMFVSRGVRALCLVCMTVFAVGGLLVAETPAKSEGRTVRTGPLKGLPSKPGPHIERIKALGDGEWLNLGRPAPDPAWGHSRGRSWCAHMNFAPDVRGAFHTGEGVHAYVKPDGYYMDDLFLYDINAHAWICIYPGTRAGDDQGLRLNEAGFFINAAGDVTAVAQLAHNYGGTTYDPDRRKFVIVPNQFVMNWWSPRKLRQAAKLLPLAREKLKAKTFGPWFWNTVTAKFEREEAQGPGPGDSVGRGIVTIYLPTARRIFVRDQKGRNWLYDPDKKAWAKAAAGPDKKIGAGMVACYDSKRDRVYLPTGGRAPQPGWFAYDVKKDEWIDLKPKGGGRNTDENATAVTYDSVNDVVVVLVFRREQRGLFVYDASTNAWLNTTPKALPDGCAVGCVSGFYDPVNNAHYYYQAYDSNTNGTVWLYRHGSASTPEAQREAE